MTTEPKQPLLKVSNLQTYFYTEDGVVKAVDGVDFEVYPGEVLSIVGESGCGKSVTSLSVMQLVRSPGKIISGNIFFENENLREKSKSELTKMRGNRFSMIFQQPQSSLNPVFTIGDQIAEVFKIHHGLNAKEAKHNAIEKLRIVGIPSPESKAKAYPHELSGGQAQRVMIAMALALNPQLLIADEPTTALDVTIQAQILDLILGLKEQMGTAVILITHDLGVVAEIADRVAVMYAGKIVETADVNTLYNSASHPYTQGLIASVPVLGEESERLTVIPGAVPNLINLPAGCTFAERCSAREEFGLEICHHKIPDLKPINGEEHMARCWLYQDDEEYGHKAPKMPSG
ncbi:MAG: ABC transporter ATP-binding protein [Chloroflexota bacterium]